MADGFGTRYQFSKRKISAMSNEDFNELTDQKLLDESLLTVKTYTQNMPLFFQEVRKVNRMIMTEFAFLFKDMVDFGGELLLGNPQAGTGPLGFPTAPTPDPNLDPNKFIPPIPGTSGDPVPGKPSHQIAAEKEIMAAESLWQTVQAGIVAALKQPNWAGSPGHNAMKLQVANLQNKLLKLRNEYKEKYGVWF